MRRWSRRQKLDLAVRIGFVIVAALVLLYDRIHFGAHPSEAPPATHSDPADSHRP